MTENRHLAAGLRTLAALTALAGLLGLAGCGGGSGAPNNVFNTPGPLTVLPAEAVAYSGVPMALTVSGGTPPYRAFSSNSALVPVQQAVAGSTIVLVPGPVATGTDVDVVITVQDNPNTGGTPPANTTVALTVRSAPLVNSLTITPTSTDCGTSAICSGQTGTATVTVLGPQGGPLAGRAVKFDVVAGPFLIATTNPAQPLVASLTVLSDANGVASVIVKANANAPTQFAQLRVTDLTSGQQLVGNFLVQQVTDGTKVLTVVPADATITGAFKGQCSANFLTDYFIYGGTPPYRVTSSFPTAVTIFNPIVNAEGGFFEAQTNGLCVDPLTFSIVDANGLQTTALLHNVEGTTEVPVPTPPTPPALAVAPASYNAVCGDNSPFPFIISGGTPPYNVKATSSSTTGGQTLTVTPSIVPKSGGSSTISHSPAASVGSITTIVILDSSSTQLSTTATITCK